MTTSVNTKQQELDKTLKDWVREIKRAANNHIPTVKYRIIPGVKQTSNITKRQSLQYRIVRIHYINKTKGTNKVKKNILRAEIILWRSITGRQVGMKILREVKSIIEENS